MLKAGVGIFTAPRTAADKANPTIGNQVTMFPVKMDPNSQTRRTWDLLYSLVDAFLLLASFCDLDATF